MQRLDRPTTCGFTILEMLIAMGITVLMLGVISRLFFETTNAISQGAALSQVIANSRAVSDQLDRDAQAIIHADEDGEDEEGNIEGGFIVIVNRVLPGVRMKRRAGGETTRSVRIDQLLFIRSSDFIEHIAPQGDNSFAPADPFNLQAPYARVWYGHVRRTQRNGTTDSGDLGQNFPTNLNRVGTNWILGRQALMLSENNGGGANIFAATAQYNSTVTRVPNPARLFMGMTDVCRESLADINEDLENATSDTDYKNRAFRYAFITERLRANPFPNGTTFDSWRIGQMHPVFMENVSDFVVEFAMNVADDPTITNDPAISGPDDGEVDINRTTGNVEWYGLGRIPAPADWRRSYPDAPHNSTPYTPINPNEVRWVFRHDYGDNWPRMIRIRYRLHDPNGRFEEFIGDSRDNRPPELKRQSGQWFEQIFHVKKSKD